MILTYDIKYNIFHLKNSRISANFILNKVMISHVIEVDFNFVYNGLVLTNCLQYFLCSSKFKNFIWDESILECFKFKIDGQTDLN